MIWGYHYFRKHPYFTHLYALLYAFVVFGIGGPGGMNDAECHGNLKEFPLPNGGFKAFFVHGSVEKREISN